MVEVGSATTGEQAERLVHDRLRAALPDEYRLFPNVRWVLREHGHDREGEADLVVAHPDLGFLVVEVKSGPIRRDQHGWWQGHKRLDRSPFTQAADSRHALVRKLKELPDWPTGLEPIAGHAVAFPGVDLRTAGANLARLDPDVDPELILDQAALAEGSDDRLRAWVDRALELWSGGRDTRAPGTAAVRLLEEMLTEPVELRSMLRNEIDAGEREVLQLTTGQYQVLNQLRRVRRAEIVGGAGTGKTMLAAEKARRLAREGFRTLLVCFNQPLARMLADATGDVAATTGLLDVSTFHQLCEDLGREAGTLPPKPNPVTSEWFSQTLPAALDAAIERLGPRYHAVVIDEGQDFDADWLLSLETLLFDAKEDVLYVFHDPAQAIYREDCVGQLGLTPHDLDLNCRNPQPIHALVSRYAAARLDDIALRTEGRPPELIAADAEPGMLDALRRVLHRLRAPDGENVAPWQIAVLTGKSLEHSAVWRQRRFGNEVLWNGQVDDKGKQLGRAASEVPAQPTDAILCDSIRRFKGLERPVVILVELEPGDRLDQLLYVGASRATQHLMVIAPREVIQR